MVYALIERLFGTQAITREMAEGLYVGMMTDTGNFSFSFLTPALYRAVAVLAETGIDIPSLHNNVYNAYTEGRARLFGYAINRKMEVIENGTVAYMSLMEHEMRRFQFQQGDSEGFVNYPLTIKKMKMSAMFLAHRKFIRISLRSRGDVDVNLFARKNISTAAATATPRAANPTFRWRRPSPASSSRYANSPRRAVWELEPRAPAGAHAERQKNRQNSRNRRTVPTGTTAEPKTDR